ncbi:MAG TPA: carbohydrate ABC transporter permease [bacterium]|nr:carbohydrate ABC transporter permease [bacterium]
MTETAAPRGRWGIMLSLVVLSAPIILMYSWLLVASFSVRITGLVPHGFTLENWRFLGRALPNEASIWTTTLNSLLFAFAVGILEVLIGSMAAYALSRLNFAGRGVVLSSTMVLHSFPSVTLLIAIFLVLRFLGLYDRLAGVILVKLALDLPLGIWIMKGFFDNVPWDIEMAALIDGCSRLRIWWRVMVPLVKPGLLAFGIFAFLSGWNEFLLPYVLLPSQNSQTLSVLMASLASEERFADYGLVTAVSVFYILPAVLVFALTQKYLLNIFSGGVKG